VQEVDYAFLVQSLYLRKLIELIDSIGILTKAKADSDSLLRTFFECVVYITHLYEKETYNRSLAFIYSQAVEIEYSNNKFNINTSSGKETLSALREEGKATLLNEYVPHIEAANLGLQFIRSKREFKEIEREYNKVKIKNGKRPEWYHLFDGSKCFKDLSCKLGFKGKYIFLFGMLSKAVHAQDIIRYKIIGDEFKYELLHNTNEYITTVNHVYLMSHKIFETYTRKLPPTEQENFSKWSIWFSLKYQKVLVT
jgi:hypothetical protein